MRKHISVFFLMARATLHKIVFLLLIMAAAECGMFYLAMNTSASDEIRQLETVAADSRMGLIFLVGMLCMVIILTASFSGSKSRQQYTLQRLQISERQVFIWHTLYNAFCFLLLWAVQMVTALLLCKIYVQMVSGMAADSGFAEANGQTVFLAFYRNAFLHNILPLESWVVWFRNILLVFSLGMALAYGTLLSHRGKNSIAAILMMSVTGSFSVQSLEDAVITAAEIFIILLISGIILERVICWKEEDYES